MKFITDNDDIEVNMDPVMFRNLYNPKTGLSGLYAACLPEEGSAFDLRTHFGVTAPDPTFVPSFLVVTDAMRSFNCRKFFRGFSGALCLRRLVFTLFIADENNPDHAPLFENYNSEVNHELGAYKMMWVPRQ